MEKDKLKVFKLKQELVQKIVELSPFLPNNSLDELIDRGPSIKERKINIRYSNLTRHVY